MTVMIGMDNVLLYLSGWLELVVATAKADLTRPNTKSQFRTPSKLPNTKTKTQD